ncbi:MAG: DUF1501 domain-containing protein [Cytophagaceae bacterium]|nr:DUF1501 domain-containing protein [Cytophagaceae bacterium]
MNRRNFLQNSALATVGSLLIPDFLKAYERSQLGVKPLTNQVLVVVQLSGGNDGLNTVVPFRNDIYYRERPRLAIQSENVLKLNDELGFNPALEKLKALYDDGHVTVINNVGYPNPDRSHFRSMDIWHTASESNQYLSSGWVGRYLDARCNGTCAPYDALEVDDTLSLAMKGERVKGMAVQNPQKLYNQTQNRFYQQLAQTNHAEFAEVDYLYKTLSETLSSAESIYEKSKVFKTSASYPESELGRRMKTVAELIGSGVVTNVYYVSLSGFDTHVNQANQQERLLRQYAEAMHAFVGDMKQNGQMKRIKVLTFSEFGRRVKQNASNGTDHGTANNAFLISEEGRGIHNAGPDLTNLDEGDLKYSVDFRRLYASLLDGWLGTPSEVILGKKFEKLAV